MLAPWKKSYDKPGQHIKKQRHYFADKGSYIVKTMAFPVVMYGWESWTIKKAEHWKIDAFEQWCQRRLLRVPWTAGRSNQSILKKINLNIHWKDDAEVETPIFWTPDVKNWLIGKDIDAGKDWRKEEKEVTEDEWLNGTTNSMDMSLSKRHEIVKDREV